MQCNRSCYSPNICQFLPVCAAKTRAVHGQCTKDVLQFLREILKYSDNRLNRVCSGQSTPCGKVQCIMYTVCMTCGSSYRYAGFHFFGGRGWGARGNLLLPPKPHRLPASIEPCK